MKKKEDFKKKCEECGQLFPSKFNLHKNEYHGHPCDDCSVKFKSKAALSHHIYRSHMTKIQLAKDDEDKDGEVSMKFEVKSDSPAKTENPEGNKTPESDNDEDKNGEVSVESEEDEVDKAEAPVGKEKTEDSKQSTPLKKPIPKDEDLPTSAVPNKEPNVLDTKEEEECETDPKEEDVDESNGEFRERSVNRLHFRQEHEDLDKKCEHIRN